MPKITLDFERLEIVSFETESPREDEGVAVISGTICVTRPTLYGTCCTP
ncbi:MAG TPA: hypothetical protein VFH27_05310 [Longimicrobiaceae bacterium]|nr:hypothetical protein [Longimicrobiaceae bacterium]